MAKKVLIIGAGASGLMAGIMAAENGADVTVLEQNDKPGRKILASGNGRCNLTNTDQSPDNYHCTDREFVSRVLRSFSAEDTLAFFRGTGVLFTEQNGWVYPVTKQSETVLQALLYRAEECGVTIKTREQVLSAEKKEDGFTVYTYGWQYMADALIVCSGSPASGVRGASDLALGIASDFGVASEGFLPSLVPLRVNGSFLQVWAGTRVHARVTLLIDDKEAGSDIGEVQLTAQGISGIPVFQISGMAVRALSENRKVSMLADFLPDVDKKELEQMISERLASFQRPSVRRILNGIVPDRIISVLQKTTPENAILSLAGKIKEFPLSIKGAASLHQAQVCLGGILTEELTERLECRNVPGLFFAGEAVNVDGSCGGYNLQWAWSSGAAAGKAAAEGKA